MQRNYVLDTPAFCSATRRITRFDEHEVVLPLVAVTELGKTNAPPTGTSHVRAASLLDDLRISNGHLDEPVGLPDGGIARWSSTTRNCNVLPSGLSSQATTTAGSPRGRTVVLRTRETSPVRDLPDAGSRLQVMGLAAEEYRERSSRLPPGGQVPPEL